MPLMCMPWCAYDRGAQCACLGAQVEKELYEPIRCAIRNETGMWLPSERKPPRSPCLTVNFEKTQSWCFFAKAAEMSRMFVLECGMVSGKI